MKHTFTLLNSGKSEKYPSMCVVYIKTTFLLTFDFSRDSFPPEVFLTKETGHHFTSIEKTTTELREELPTDLRGAHQHTTNRKEALYHS